MTFASTLLLTSVPLLVTYYVNLYKSIDLEKAFSPHPKNFTLPVKEVFDFIIVGAGTAGCILANRLSKNYTVLLLEAGGDVPPIQNVPQLSQYTWDLADFNFKYQTVPQKKLNLINNGINTLPSGKMLGGSNTHNGLVWERGHPLCYDKWAQLTRDTSWKYNNVKKYYKDIERYYTVAKEKNDERGFNGMVYIQQDTFHPGQDLYLEAAPYVNLQVVSTSKAQTAGFKIPDASKKNGVRETSYTAYLKPVECRETLKVYKYSVVSKVIMENTQAVGVEYERHGIPRAAYASKEVILSAGAFMSPMILIKSGIGPVEEVAKANVEQVAIVPVGEKVKDHLKYQLPSLRIDPQYTWTAEVNLTQKDIDDFALYQTGPLTGFPFSNAEAFATSSFAKALNWPDLQLVYLYNGNAKRTRQ